MRRNMKEWKNGILISKERIAIPIMTHPGLHFAEKNTIDAVKSGDWHSAAVIALAREFPSGAATMMMDLSVEAEAFGAPVVFKEIEVPTVSARIVIDEKTVTALAVPTRNTSASRAADEATGPPIAADARRPAPAAVRRQRRCARLPPVPCNSGAKAPATSPNLVSLQPAFTRWSSS